MRTEAYQAGLLVKHIDQATPYHWSQHTLEQKFRSNKYQQTRFSHVVCTSIVLGAVISLSSL